MQKRRSPSVFLSVCLSYILTFCLSYFLSVFLIVYIFTSLSLVPSFQPVYLLHHLAIYRYIIPTNLSIWYLTISTYICIYASFSTFLPIILSLLLWFVVRSSQTFFSFWQLFPLLSKFATFTIPSGVILPLLFFLIAVTSRSQSYVCKINTTPSQ
jgi:hypothetical protein